MPSRRAVLASGAAAWLLHGDARAGDEADQDLLARQIDPGRISVGLAAALIGPDGAARVVTAGGAGAPDRRALDGGTLFEIGSVTKVFTALLLADMAERGEARVDEPVAALLLPEGRPRAFDGQAMSLLDLATHTSGLPRLPGNLRPADPADPYADYTLDQLDAFVSGWEPKVYPGSRYEYSNLGFALLGRALCLRAGRGYEELVVERICDPLGLDATRVALRPELQARLAPGHDAALRPAENWNLSPAAAPAGGLRSCADDLARFLNAARGVTPSPLSGAFARLLLVRRQTGEADRSAAAGWFVANARGDEIVFKDGGTGGYASLIGWSQRSGRAAAVLANAACYGETAALGLHLIDAGFPLKAAPAAQPADPQRLEAYAGRYAFTPDFVLTVTPKDGTLVAQATGQPALPVFPDGEDGFAYRAVDARLTFEKGPDGKAAGVTLHQNGRDLHAARVP